MRPEQQRAMINRSDANLSRSFLEKRRRALSFPSPKWLRGKGTSVWCSGKHEGNCHVARKHGSQQLLIVDPFLLLPFACIIAVCYWIQPALLASSIQAFILASASSSLYLFSLLRLSLFFGQCSLTPSFVSSFLVPFWAVRERNRETNEKAEYRERKRQRRSVLKETPTKIEQVIHTLNMSQVRLYCVQYKPFQKMKAQSQKHY